MKKILNCFFNKFVKFYVILKNLYSQNYRQKAKR